MSVNIEEATRAELEEALAHLNASAKRIPRHFTERKAAVHAVIDARLTEWQQVGPNCRTCGRTKANCDAEPRRCCEVCQANGHGE